MKTNLNRTITTQDEAEAFLSELFENTEYFNPDDNAHEVIWQTCSPTDDEKDKLNVLMSATFIDGFDPHGYLLDMINDDERREILARPEYDSEQKAFNNRATYLERNED